MTYGATPERTLDPSNATTILVLGILSLVLGCSILGIITWIMGNDTLRRMDAGTMQNQDRSLAAGGRICGIISALLIIPLVIFFLIPTLRFMTLG